MPFRTLCHELSQLQVQLLRREVSPAIVTHEAAQLLDANRDAITPVEANIPLVPQFLRSCGTVFRRPSEEGQQLTLSIIVPLAREYVLNGHGDVNDSGNVLQALLQLAQSVGDEREAPGGDWERGEGPGCRGCGGVRSLIEPCYNHVLQRWREQRVRPFTSTMITLLRGCNAVHGGLFHFTPVSAEMSGLLPMRSKMQMEAKMQRCANSRDILHALCDMKLSRFDAGMGLDAMASTGLYNEELSNKCCEVLHATHAVVTGQQFAGVLYSLGVLQHRHVHQKFFSSLVNFKRCNAEAVRQHLVGLAMLHQPPHSEKVLMDGIFLHALRRASVESGGGRSELPFSWFVDVGHALTCVGIAHFKYRLMMAREVRRDVRQMSTLERTKLLYALGNSTLADIPEGLHASWSSKVQRLSDTVVERLKFDVTIAEGPAVMNALVWMGVREHPMIPRPPDLMATENPVEVLLKTWATCPKERVLDLTERIRSRHLGGQPTQRISEVFVVLAANCADSSLGDGYRFGPLCEAANEHIHDMTVDEALRTLSAIEQIGIGSRFTGTITRLLERLWATRFAMSHEEQIRCSKTLEPLCHYHLAMDILEHLSNAAVQ